MVSCTDRPQTASGPEPSVYQRADILNPTRSSGARSSIAASSRDPSSLSSKSRFSRLAPTNRLRDAAKLIEVTLHEHIIVTPGAAFSFREKGLI